MSVLSGLDIDHTTSSVSPYSYQHPFEVHISPAALSAHDPAPSPRLDSYRNSGNYTSPTERVSPLMSQITSPLSSQGNPAHESAMQQQHSPSQDPRMVYQKPWVQGRSPISAKSSGMALGSASSLRSGSPSNTDGILHHVYVDAVCTNEQLGKVMSTLVGLVKSVTVKASS